MRGAGPRAIGVSFPEPMVLTVTCTDPARGSFFDVQRPGQDARRQGLEPGEKFSCRLLAGPADITFGYATEFVFEVEGAA